MTLLRELALYLTLLLLLLFTGIFVMNLNDARHYLQDQLESHAQDTATSLGIAISATEADNVAVIDSLIDAVFDRGYYRVIRFTSPDGTVLVNSEHELKLDTVPYWFIRLVDLEAPEVTSEVNRGWMPAGTLYVASHPGVAYRSLWNKTRNGVWLFGGGLLLAILGLNVFLSVVLRPLKKLEQQANAICERSFVQQATLPRTRDLRRVVEAMNRMAGKLETLFTEKEVLTEELRKQSVKDALTGLLNRRAFEDRVSNVLLGEELRDYGGGLLMVRVSGLEAFNNEHGVNAADLLLVEIAHRLESTLESWPEAILGRSSGSEFAVFVPNCDQKQGHRIAEACFRVLASMPFFISDEGQDRLHIAMVTHQGRTLFNTVLQEADQLLRRIQRQSGNSWKVRQIDNGAPHPHQQWSEGNWQESLRQVLQNQEVELVCQDVVNRDEQPLFHEVFARLRLMGERVSAEAFLPMVERFELHIDFDKVVVNALMSYLQNDGSAACYCINLSPRSFVDDAFQHWLLARLKASPEI